MEINNSDNTMLELTDAIHRLKQDAKKNPNYMSFSDLGAFYLEHGTPLANGTTRDATIYGLRYLSKALMMCRDEIVLFNIAKGKMKLQQYEEALALWRETVEKYKKPLYYYFMAVCTYHLHRYDETVDLLKECLRLDTTNHLTLDGCIHPLVFLAYTEYMRNNVEGCRDAVEQYRKNYHDVFDEVDVFQLRVLCQDYDNALSEYHELLTGWVMTDEILEYLAVCLNARKEYCPVIEALLSEESKQKLYKYIKKQKPIQCTFEPPVALEYLFYRGDLW